MAQEQLALSAGNRTDAYLDWLQMLSGAALIIFMWMHMVLVASILIGAGAMNAIAGFLEDTYLAQLGGPVLFLLFLVHFGLTARKVPFRIEQQKIIWKHAQRMKHLDTWLWLVQAGSAMLILIMGGIHMWTVLTDLPILASKSAARMQQWQWTIFYLVLLPLVELHVGVGFYRIGVKWGYIRRDNRKKAKKIENSLLILFLVLGLLSLIRFLTFTVA